MRLGIHFLYRISPSHYMTARPRRCSDLSTRRSGEPFDHMDREVINVQRRKLEIRVISHKELK